jgi:hypothetical protein
MPRGIQGSSPPCKEEFCKLASRCGGYCMNHYMRNRERNRKYLESINIIDRECAIEGCKRMVRTREMCNLHYRRYMKHGDPNYVMERGGFSDKRKMKQLNNFRHDNDDKKVDLNEILQTKFWGILD